MNNTKYSEDELKEVSIPKFFPDHDGIKSDIVTNYKNIEKLDKQIGLIINQLKADNLYENTIIFFFSDHGGPFPRYKRSIYETGIKVPFIAKWIDYNRTGNTNQLVSFVDFAPTILDAAKIDREFSFEGVSFFKKDQRNYVYAATDRFDASTDKRRSIRGKKFKLIYNGDTTTSVYQPVIYRQKMKTMQVLDSLYKIQELNTYFSNWFSKNKYSFELYEVSEDYSETNNLINNPKFQRIRKKLQHHLFKWMEESDFGNMNESAMLDSMFTNYIIPRLNTPELTITDLGYLIIPNNLHVSVGWRYKKETKWKIYKKGDLIQPKNDLEVLLFKPGYEVLIKDFKK